MLVDYVCTYKKVNKQLLQKLTSASCLSGSIQAQSSKFAKFGLVFSFRTRALSFSFLFKFPTIKPSTNMFGGGVVRVFSTDAVPSTDVVVVGVPVVVVVVVVVALVVRLLFGGTLTEKKISCNFFLS